VIPTAERSVEAVCSLVERHGIELLPTTPTFLNMLLIAGAHRRYDLSSLRLITFGTEPMPPATLDAVREAFSGVELKQTYGLTELGVLPTRAWAPGSLWLQVGGEGFETRIERGTLRIRAESAMLGYLNAPSPFDADGWFDTGDVVEERDGFVRILGRGCEIINVGGEKVAPVEVEDVLLRLDNVCDAAVYGLPNPITGQLVNARVRLERPEDPALAERRLRDQCRRLLAPHKVPAVVELVDGPLHGNRFKRVRRAAERAPE
jgi:acyl-coenzyme A synthetase/AMP-(fatty) acid ligase